MGFQFSLSVLDTWSIHPALHPPISQPCLCLLPIYLQALLGRPVPPALLSQEVAMGGSAKDLQQLIQEWLGFGVIGPLTPIPNCCDWQTWMHVLPHICVCPLHFRRSQKSYQSCPGFLLSFNFHHCFSSHSYFGTSCCINHTQAWRRRGNVHLLESMSFKVFSPWAHLHAEWWSEGRQEEKYRRDPALPLWKGCVQQDELKSSATPVFTQSDSAAFPGHQAHPPPQTSCWQAQESNTNICNAGLEVITQSLQHFGSEKCRVSTFIYLGARHVW